MVIYTHDSYLKPLSEGDATIKIKDTNDVIRFSIVPGKVVNTMVNNNTININFTSRLLIIPFSTVNESRLALPLLQNQIDKLKNII